jgi:hypothetical protein
LIAIIESAALPACALALARGGVRCGADVGRAAVEG